MAKWGEGDDRWIVEERPDAKNCNNWHCQTLSKRFNACEPIIFFGFRCYDNPHSFIIKVKLLTTRPIHGLVCQTEKDATNWSRDVMKGLFKDFDVKENNYYIKIEEIDSMDGDATACNRKGNILVFFDWKLSFKFFAVNDNSEYNGTITIPNFDDLEMDGLDIQVSSKTEDKNWYDLKNYIRSKLFIKIKDQLNVYTKKLKEEFTDGMILPSHNTLKKEPKTTKPTYKNPDKLKHVNNTSESQKTDSLLDSVTFLCSGSDLFRVLTRQQEMQIFSRSVAKSDPVENGLFQLYNAMVTGKFLKLTENAFIEMEWRLSDWPENVVSNVKITLKDEGNGTKLHINQTGIPSKYYEQTKCGWRTFYWEALSSVFGFTILR
ncbi:Activator of HSP90 heat shock protein ATPase [Intoshia linei]|uniref:Activator of HSP90 heat shock protein ATPase n=1 Tax=Intoshia linei TaxID=1819745 RepID=A0A177B240_9BILA|nr:Activator of HSP90 heat shock protein ATPase [Intoshia linei]